MCFLFCFCNRRCLKRVCCLPDCGPGTLDYSMATKVTPSVQVERAAVRVSPTPCRVSVIQLLARAGRTKKLCASLSLQTRHFCVMPCCFSSHPTLRSSQRALPTFYFTAPIGGFAQRFLPSISPPFLPLFPFPLFPLLIQ